MNTCRSVEAARTVVRTRIGSTVALYSGRVYRNLRYSRRETLFARGCRRMIFRCLRLMSPRAQTVTTVRTAAACEHDGVFHYTVQARSTTPTANHREVQQRRRRDPDPRDPEPSRRLHAPLRPNGRVAHMNTARPIVRPAPSPSARHATPTTEDTAQSTHGPRSSRGSPRTSIRSARPSASAPRTRPTRRTWSAPGSLLPPQGTLANGEPPAASHQHENAHQEQRVCPGSPIAASNPPPSAPAPTSTYSLRKAD